MNNTSKKFNKQLELDVMISGLTEITKEYVYEFNWQSLTEVVIPIGVTSIGEGAFAYCRGLTHVTIPDTVTTIGEEAFSDCNLLRSVTIGKGVTRIEDYAFWYCQYLTSITIPASVTSIGDDAFYNCDEIDITFEGKTLDEVRSMEYYPWGLSPENIHVQVQ